MNTAVSKNGFSSILTREKHCLEIHRMNLGFHSKIVPC